MKINKIASALAIIVPVFCGQAAYAAGEVASNTGKVEFQGELLNSACSLDNGTPGNPIVVDFGQIATHVLMNEGKSDSKPFQIGLTNCDSTVASSVSVTFNATPDANNNKLIGLTSGTARNAGIGLTDGASVDVEIGKPTSPSPVTEGDVTLNFAAYVQGDSASASNAPVPGDFYSSSNFTVDYQ